MTTYRVWPATNGPSSDAGDHSAYSMGMEVYATQDVWVTAIHYWRGTTGIAPVVDGAIYEVTGQTIVPGTQVTFSDPGAATGWLTATLPTPVKLTALTRFKVAVLHPDNYSATSGYWGTGPGVGGITNGPLVAPDAGATVGGSQDTYHAGSTLSWPHDSFGQANYWVDLSVSDVLPGQTVQLGTAAETDTAQPLTVSHLTGLTQATEADTAAPITAEHRVTLGQAGEADTATAVTPQHDVAVAQTSETDTATAIDPARGISVDQAAEADTATAITAEHRVTVGQAHEADTAGSITSPGHQPHVLRSASATITSTGRRTATITQAGRLTASIS